MNSIYKYLLIAGLALYSIFATKSCIDNNSNAKRWATNYAIEAGKLNSNRAKTVTVDEFNKLYDKYTSLADSLDINPKKIQTVVEVEYKYKDTTIATHTTVIDSVTRELSFATNDDCYQIAGTVKGNNVNVDVVEVFDILTTYIYEEKEEWFWGIKKFWKKPYVTSKVYSDCIGDTISVQEHIQIIK